MEQKKTLKQRLKKIFIFKVCKECIRFIVYKSRDIFAKITNHKFEDKIVFTTTTGTYSCNPKAICDEIIAKKLPYKLVWAVFKRNLLTEQLQKQYPKELKVVLKGSYDFYKEINSAKILLENEHNFGRRWYFKKRKGQYMINTWHGSMGLKRIAIDNSFSAHLVIKKNIYYQKQTDFMISNSDFETNVVYRTTYWPKNTILEYGHARNDILFKSKTSKEVKVLNKKVREFFNIDKDSKIFLYAPTFREKNLDVNSKLEVDYKQIKKALEKRFGGKWELIVRFHEKERTAHPDYDKKYGVLDGTLYPDMQELLAVVDCGVTDYSSWICDYVFTRRPGFLLTPDLEEYSSIDRGFYYDLNETPFPIAITSDELVRKILEFDEKEYEKKTKKFLELRGSIEDGKATKRIVDLIQKLMKESK